MGVVDKLRALNFLTQNAKNDLKTDEFRISTIENILFGEKKPIPLPIETQKEDAEFQMLYKVTNDRGLETLKVSVVELEDAQPIDYVTDEEICSGYENETIIALMHWILTDKDYSSYSSCSDVINAIKTTYEQYNCGKNEKNIFSDIDGNPYPEEIVVRNINARIATDMLKCYNELNPTRQIDNRLLKSTIMDEVLFHGLYSTLNLHVENIPNISARDILVNGIKSLPGFSSLEEKLARPTNKDFENTVGIDRIAEVVEHGIDLDKTNENDREQSQG